MNVNAAMKHRSLVNRLKKHCCLLPTTSTNNTNVSDEIVNLVDLIGKCRVLIVNFENDFG